MNPLEGPIPFPPVGGYSTPPASPETPRKRQKSSITYYPAVQEAQPLQRGSFQKGKPPTFDGKAEKDHVIGSIFGKGKEAEIRQTEDSRYLVRQQSLQGCGGGCVLMVALDKTEGRLPEEWSDAIWHEIFHGSLLRVGDLLRLLKKAGVNAAERSYYTEDVQESGVLVKNGEEALADIAKNVPMIVGIAHPRLEGHWIVIDKVKDGKVWLRDPYTGMAFIRPSSEIASMILQDVIKEACLKLT